MTTTVGATEEAKRDRFGNEFAPGVPYARGQIVTSTEDDFLKMQEAWRHIRNRGVENIYNFSGLEHGLPLEPDELPIATDFIAPALHFERFREAALDHLGGDPDRHDAALFNRITAATLATHVALCEPGQTVIGVSASYSHPSVVRASQRVGTTLIDTAGVDQFGDALAKSDNVGLVVMTRLAVTYEVLPLEQIAAIVQMAHARDIKVYVDDAGGARIGPALFDQPKALELGVDVVATGLDKYGVQGPRLGVLAGEKDLVATIRARGFELGGEARPLLYPAATRSLEASTPERVRELVATTREIAEALKKRIGSRLNETDVIAELLAEDILEIALERAGLTIEDSPIVPFEATASLAMLLLRDHGAITVHFIGLPPGTAAVMIKFIPPEVLAEFGGPDAYAEAVDSSLDKLAALMKKPDEFRALLLGSAAGNGSANGAADA